MLGYRPRRDSKQIALSTDKSLLKVVLVDSLKRNLETRTAQSLHLHV